MTKSTKPQIKIFNCETGEEIIRDATAEEIAQMEIDIEASQAKKAAHAEKENQRQTILDRLGLTADEAALLLS
jgi:hypothetical protein